MKLVILIVSMCMAFGSAYAQTDANEKQKEKPDTLKKELKEVTVEGDKIVTTPDKMMIFVDKSVKNHSYDGYTALSLLQIPGLRVDAIDGNVSALAGGVLLCINGLESTQKEIKTLNPKDILRIDYYTGYDPRHPNARNVIDFIMKERDYGGMVMLQATQSLNVATGADMADWKMYHKKSEFGVNVLYNFMHYTQDTGNSSSRYMSFTDGDVTRISRSMPTKNSSNAYDITMSYIQRFKSSNLKVALNLAPKHAVGNGSKKVIYTGLEETEEVSVDDNHNDELTPSFNILYDHMFKNKSMLMVKTSGSYYTTDISRDYFGLEDILSKTKGHGASVAPTLIYTFPQGKIFTPGVGVEHHYTHTNSRYYQNGDVTHNKYTFQETLLFAYLQMQFNQSLRGHIELHGHLIEDDPGTGSHHEYKITPFFMLNYNLPKNGGSLNFEASMENITPRSGWVNPILRQRDEFLATVGNPYLRTATMYELKLNYYLFRKWGDFSIFSQYRNISKAPYRNYICDDENDMFLESYANGGNFESFILNASVQWRIVPNRVNLMASANYSRYKVRTYQLMHLNRMNAMVKANYMNRGFVAELEVGAPVYTLNSAGMYQKNPYKVNLTLGYNINGWSFNFMTRNPFMKTYSEVILNQPRYKTNSRTYNPKLGYDYFAVRISYRFNYGKPHNFDNVGADSKVKKYDLGE